MKLKNLYYHQQLFIEIEHDHDEQIDFKVKENNQLVVHQSVELQRGGTSLDFALHQEGVCEYDIYINDCLLASRRFVKRKRIPTYSTDVWVTRFNDEITKWIGE